MESGHGGRTKCTRHARRRGRRGACCPPWRGGRGHWRSAARWPACRRLRGSRCPWTRRTKCARRPALRRVGVGLAAVGRGRRAATPAPRRCPARRAGKGLAHRPVRAPPAGSTARMTAASVPRAGGARNRPVAPQCPGRWTNCAAARGHAGLAGDSPLRRAHRRSSSYTRG